MTQSFNSAQFSNHAIEEMQRRGINEKTVKEIIANPDSVHDIRPGRVVLHKTIIDNVTQKTLLYRVFIDIDRLPPVIVTTYKTSKIAKYEKLQ